MGWHPFSKDSIVTRTKLFSVLAVARSEAIRERLGRLISQPGQVLGRAALHTSRGSHSEMLLSLRPGVTTRLWADECSEYFQATSPGYEEEYKQHVVSKHLF